MLIPPHKVSLLLIDLVVLFIFMLLYRCVFALLPFLGKIIVDSPFRTNDAGKTSNKSYFISIIVILRTRLFTKSPLSALWPISWLSIDNQTTKNLCLVATSTCRTVALCRSGLVVSASYCGVRRPSFESHRGRLCLSRVPLWYAVLGTGCAPLLQCLGQLSLASFQGR